MVWESFRDISYYDMFAVRKITERAFNQAIHVHTEEEAVFLVMSLNELEKLKSHNKDYAVQQEASPKLPSLEVLTEELIKTGWLLRASGDNLFEENKRYGVEVVLSVIKRLGDFA